MCSEFTQFCTRPSLEMKTGWQRPCYRLYMLETFSGVFPCLLVGWRDTRAVKWVAGWRLRVEQQLSRRKRGIRCIMGTWRGGVGVWPRCTGMQHAHTGKRLLYLATYTHEHLLFACAMACVWYLSLGQLFWCGSVFDFSISQLTGWQFKTTEWNISQPFSKLQWHTHEVMVFL